MNAEILESIVATHLPAAAKGDQQAYGRIVAGCQNTVTSIALAIVRDVPASEDIAQEAFISAWQQLDKLSNHKSFMPWLRQITRNLSLDYLRSQKYRANPAGDIDAMMLAVADPAPGPSEFLAEQEDAKIAAAVIDALPEESREVLLLYYREGQSTQQVAALLDMQDAAVRKRLSRARQSIREELLTRMGDFVKSTSPTMAFTTMVTTSPGMDMQSAVGVAAAAITGGSIATKGMATGSVGIFAGSSIGVFSGLIGLWGSISHFIVKPFDAKEKQQLIAYGLINSAVFTSIVYLCVFVFKASVASMLSACIGVLLCLAVSNIHWLPHILKRRAEYDREHPQNFQPQNAPKSVWRRIVAAYSKKTPRYFLHPEQSNTFYFWLTGIPGELLSPIDAQEKKSLIRFSWVVNGTAILFIALLAVFIDQKSMVMTTGSGVTFILSLAFIGLIIYSFQSWLPSILARRRAVLQTTDPEAYEIAQSKQRADHKKTVLIILAIMLISMLIGFIYGVVSAMR
jgi:RNA polymerase sigma factor (sigma-70 family)